ncbi:Translation initiation factor IF-2, mitochondrial [Colletotrichum chlorophyti]|uniref:Translation initiation factor IF-2, mitochondrial n=1 Tax=Colletotrichum chlorophyti TaxID=708187 RepID=A0A1Q8S132_9PEZI|nr:Translation initiation factor IF-2, mitochondrial [Colletotrichum chlorophyti]
MLRCRIWNERSGAYVCAFCRHHTLPRQRDFSRRNYSDASKPHSHNGGSREIDNEVRASGASSTAARRPSVPVHSAWGKPTFGAAAPPETSSVQVPPSTGSQTTTTSRSSSILDDLLPHERAARERLAAQRAAKEAEAARLAKEAAERATQRASFQNRTGQPPKKGLGGLGGGLVGSQIARGSLHGNTEAKVRSQGGLDDKPLRSAKDKSSRPSAARLLTNDWRHRRDTDRAPTGTPIPHHRHASPLQKDSRQQRKSTGLSDTWQSASWSQLAKKSETGSSKGTSSGELSNASMSKEDFFVRFQEQIGSKYDDGVKKRQAGRSGLDQGKTDKSSTAEPLQSGYFRTGKIVEEPQKPERRTREFDESYEISRNSRGRDRTGDRSFRGSKKTAAQQRWEDENEEWDDKGAKRVADRRRKKAEERERRLAKEEAAAAAQTIFLPEFISISNLGTALKMKPREFLKALGDMGFEDITEDSIMTGETAALVAMEFGFDPTVDTGGVRDLRPRPQPEDVSVLPQRPPVVTIMGHVDHGKTTLLDYLRKSSVAAQEHGGITQHIGAFRVKMSSGKLITFLDTPGHAAFLTMRQRGANVTDIVILVVAADDSVKPQTLEALKHARAAKVPMIVAINKIDKEDARPDQVKSDLARHGVEIEDFGGDVQVVCVSGKTGQGMDELEENIVTLAEIQDMRAETDGLAEAWVLEASVKPWGKSANVLVKRGTLRPGDFIVAGTTWARVRVLRDEAGKELTEAPPGTPVEVLGWRDELPAAGDQILQAPDEDRARTAVDYREEMREREASSKQLAEQEQRERDAKIAAEAAAEAAAAEAEGVEVSPTKIVNFIVRGDVVGSVEAVCATISEIGNNEVKSRILRSSAGQVSESDVEHAAASNSVIANFNNSLSGQIKHLAEEKGVKILDHTIIYHLADDVKQVMSENLADKVSSKVVGEAEILQIFPINIKGRVYKNIAGCKVRNGLVGRSASVRVLRRGEKIFDGKIDTLKHGKKDVNEIRKGTECGIAFDGFTDFQVGDQIQAYEEVREKRNL